MSSDIILGSIYWPIAQPYKILRSEKIPYPFPTSSLFENSMELYCPHLQSDKDCIFKKTEKPCAYKSSNGGRCHYSSYHKFFLLLEENGNSDDNGFLKGFNESLSSDSKTYSDLFLPENRKHLLNAINAFPQAGKTELFAYDEAVKGIPVGCFFHIPEPHTKIKSVNKPDKVNNKSNRFGINDIAYMKSEFSKMGDEEKKKASSDAFLMLVKKDNINKLLPPDNMEKVNGEVDVYLPVHLSFFADSKVDASLSLAIRVKQYKFPSNVVHVRQALGSLLEVIYNKRLEFLEKWCMRLGERVDDIVQNNNPESQEEATKEAMEFALRAILKMAQSLAVRKSVLNIKGIIKEFNYDIGEKKPPGQIFNCINEKYIKTIAKISSDRKKYIIDFIKKAELYAEEFVVSEGKLKGRLSAHTVRELKKICRTSDPVNARILIRGEPGGGKGATAEDFHLYCMKRIAKTIQEIESERINKASEIDIVPDGPDKEKENEKLEKDPYTYLIKHNKYLKEVERNLKAIFVLPAIYSEKNEVLKGNFFIGQISNTGWWLWDRDLKPGEVFEEQLKTNLKESLGTFNKVQEQRQNEIKIAAEKKEPTDRVKKAENYFSEGDGSKDGLIIKYIKLLKDKILFENSSKKPDWSFNLLQVNCGILGGENSELAEAIERLFGKFGSHETTMPGLFQTCSYMGGTLFLDEIADAPVRVQDNLLRPLEEGTVSRPGWETFDEKVENIRIVGATFKDLFKLSQQYQQTLSSGNPKGFRPDLLTRLTRNTPVFVTPIWKYFVPTETIDDDFPNQFAFVLNNSWEVSSEFWLEVYLRVYEQINEHYQKARHHLSGTYEGRRKFASKITMRLFKEVGKIAQLKDSTNNNEEIDSQHISALDYLDRMLDYLLVETN